MSEMQQKLDNVIFLIASDIKQGEQVDTPCMIGYRQGLMTCLRIIKETFPEQYAIYQGYEQSNQQPAQENH